MAKITAPPPLCSECRFRRAVVSYPQEGGTTLHKCMPCIRRSLKYPPERKKWDRVLGKLGLT